MDKIKIEAEAHALHREIWMRRQNIWPDGLPALESMLDPRIAARVLSFELEVRERLGGDGSRQWGAPAAGFLDRGRGLIVVSSQFDDAVQRFTAAHEAAHVVLHPWIGDKVVHRDLPLESGLASRRAAHDQEADYFAACYLMPRRLVEKEFGFRFGSRTPLPLTETVAFHLRVRDDRALFSAPRGSLLFARLVASAQSFDTKRFDSLADHFRVSPAAMAIRLKELQLVCE